MNEPRYRKSEKMATVAQLNRDTGNYSHIERRVYEDDEGVEMIRINGFWFSVNMLRKIGHDVDVWFEGGK